MGIDNDLEFELSILKEMEMLLNEKREQLLVSQSAEKNIIDEKLSSIGIDRRLCETMIKSIEEDIDF